MATALNQYNKLPRILVSTIGTLLVVALKMPVAAAPFTYHVRVPADGGSDSNDGLTPSSAFATISRAASVAQPGDTVLVYTGVFPETVAPANSGNDSGWITYRAADGHTPIIDGGFVRSLGFDWTNRTHFVIEGFVVRHCTDIGIGNQRPGKMIVRRVVAHGNGSAGIAMNYSGSTAPHGVPSQITVEDCITYENGWGIGWASGIHLNNKGQGAGTYHIIRRNISFNNYDGSTNHTDGNGIMFDIGGAGSYALIENNICFNNGGRGINVKWGRADILNNVCYRNGWDTNFPYKPGEMAIDAAVTPNAIANWEQAKTETSQSIIRNNILWMRPRRNAWGQAFEAWGVDPATITVDSNLVWADIPAEAPTGLYSYMTNTLLDDPRFTAAPQDNTVAAYQTGLRLFMDFSAYNFRLLASSPALDVATAGPIEDILHRPRPYGSGPDLGAYEMRYVFGATQQSLFTSIGAEDGRTWGSTSGHGHITGTPAGEDLRLGDTADLAYRSIVSFDTSSLPSATQARVVAARLQLARAAVSGSNPFSWGNGIRLDMTAGTFSAAALETSDFATSPTHPNIASLDGDPGPGQTLLSTPFATAALRDLVSRPRTQFRLQFNVPALVNSFAWDWVSFYSGEATNADLRPALIVDWQPLLGEAPVVADSLMVQ